MRKVAVIFTVFSLFALLSSCGNQSYAPGRMGLRPGLDAWTAPPDQKGARRDYFLVETNRELFHYDSGSGEVVLVLHGGPGFPGLKPWAGLEKLANGRRFVYIHQRGCGNSTRPVDRFTSGNFYNNFLTLTKELGIEAQLADIERVRRILGVEKITIAGHSFGGFLAALYAVEFPQRVEKLVLVSPADLVVMPQKSGGLYQQVAMLLKDSPMRDDYVGYLRRFFDYSRLFEKNESNLSALNAGFIPFYAEAYRAKGLSADLAAFNPAGVGGWLTPALFFDMGREHDYSAAFASIRCPVLVIAGEKDVSPPDTMAIYTNLIAGSRMEVLSNSGHFSFDEEPGLFAETVGAFLGGAK